MAKKKTVRKVPKRIRQEIEAWRAEQEREAKRAEGFKVIVDGSKGKKHYQLACILTGDRDRDDDLLKALMRSVIMAIRWNVRNS